MKPEDYYCPSCKHRIEFTESAPESPAEPQPVAEMVQLSHALIISSVLYAVSVVLTTAESAIELTNTGSYPGIQSIVTMASIAMASVSAFYLAAYVTGPAHKIRSLHYPSLLTFLLGVANLLLVIGLASIFPFPSTLNNIVTGLGNSAQVLQLASQYTLFFALVGIAGLLGILGTIGLIMVLHRSSRILRQQMIYYGLVAGVACTFIELFTGLSAVLLLAPIFIIIGARRSLEPDLTRI